MYYIMDTQWMRGKIFVLLRIISVRSNLSIPGGNATLSRESDEFDEEVIHPSSSKGDKAESSRSIKDWGRTVRTSAVEGVGRVASAPCTAAQGPRDLAVPKCTNNASLWWWPRSTPLSLSHETHHLARTRIWFTAVSTATVIFSAEVYYKHSSPLFMLFNQLFRIC